MFTKLFLEANPTHESGRHRSPIYFDHDTFFFASSSQVNASQLQTIDAHSRLLVVSIVDSFRLVPPSIRYADFRRRGLTAYHGDDWQDPDACHRDRSSLTAGRLAAFVIKLNRPIKPVSDK